MHTKTELFNKSNIAPGAGETVVVAMSGGVDSSVAAALLHEHGYRIVGITLNLWDYHASGGNVNLDSGCCSIDTMADARAVCHKLGVPHYVSDFREIFERSVQQNFIDEYFTGRTPNPCVRCNTFIKWGALLQQTQDIGGSFMATGHYGRTRFNAATNRWELLRAVDGQKDQSYALWGVRQEALARTIFPLGELTKPEVREIARGLGLKTAEKKESQEICFIPDNDYRRYLRERAPEAAAEIGAGEVVDVTGNHVGAHQGFPFYTVGQRKGLGLAVGRPIFITAINAETNTIVVGDDENLRHSDFIVSSVNWGAQYCPAEGTAISCKIRYRDSGAPAILLEAEPHRVRVHFDSPQRAITPGQSAVFYDGDIVVGGGVIDSITKK